MNHFLHLLLLYCPVLVELYSPVKFQLIELSHKDIKMIFMCAKLHSGDFDYTYICTSAWLYLTFFILIVVFIVLSSQSEFYWDQENVPTTANTSNSTWQYWGLGVWYLLLLFKVLCSHDQEWNRKENLSGQDTVYTHLGHLGIQPE